MINIWSLIVVKGGELKEIGMIEHEQLLIKSNGDIEIYYPKIELMSQYLGHKLILKTMTIDGEINKIELPKWSIKYNQNMIVKLK